MGCALFPGKKRCPRSNAARTQSQQVLCKAHTVLYKSAAMFPHRVLQISRARGQHPAQLPGVAHRCLWQDVVTRQLAVFSEEDQAALVFEGKKTLRDHQKRGFKSWLVRFWNWL